jgi:hypothetical protein
MIPWCFVCVSEIKCEIAWRAQTCDHIKDRRIAAAAMVPVETLGDQR